MCHHKCRCHIWSDRFWFGFCEPRHPGVFIIALDLVVAIIYTCCYILLAIYIGSMAASHADAYLILFVSNFLIVVIGFLIIHFLTMRPEDLTIIRCASLYLLQLLAFVLGLTAIAKFNISPTNAEVMEYATDFFEDHNQVPRFLLGLQRENKCCGVKGLNDFIPTGAVNISKVPDSCCKNHKRYCGDFQRMGLHVTPEELRNNQNFFHMGCFGNKSYNELDGGSFATLNWVVFGSYVNILLIIILFTVYSYYVCYKLPKEDDQPPWAQGEFFDKMSSPFKRNGSGLYLNNEQKPKIGIGLACGSDFERRHSLSKIDGSFTSFGDGTAASSKSISISEEEGLVRPSGSSAMDFGHQRQQASIEIKRESPEDDLHYVIDKHVQSVDFMSSEPKTSVPDEQRQSIGSSSSDEHWNFFSGQERQSISSNSSENPEKPVTDQQKQSIGSNSSIHPKNSVSDEPKQSPEPNSSTAKKSVPDQPRKSQVPDSSTRKKSVSNQPRPSLVPNTSTPKKSVPDQPKQSPVPNSSTPKKSA